MKTKRKVLVHSMVAAVAAGSIGAAQLAYAQGAALEEVIVSARKKEETIQDVPLAVSAISRESVESAFLMDSTGLSQFAPNIVFDEISAGAPGGGGISIRGISFQDVEKTFDPAVLIYVDDVALGSNTGNVMNMLDVERVEVLRGPQGTLFGKNAVGGVISIHRIKPITGQWAGKARVRIGDYERRDVEGVVNIPIGDAMAAKVSVARLEQNEGFYKNVTQNTEEGDNL
jgi:iron complex outermembrane recepter protein